MKFNNLPSMCEPRSLKCRRAAAIVKTFESCHIMMLARAWKMEHCWRVPDTTWITRGCTCLLSAAMAALLTQLGFTATPAGVHRGGTSMPATAIARQKIAINVASETTACRP